MRVGAEEVSVRGVDGPASPTSAAGVLSGVQQRGAVGKDSQHKSVDLWCPAHVILPALLSHWLQITDFFLTSLFGVHSKGC